jgi:hypothetical protein
MIIEIGNNESHEVNDPLMLLSLTPINDDAVRDDDALSWLFLASDLAPLDHSIAFPPEDEVPDLQDMSSSNGKSPPDLALVTRTPILSEDVRASAASTCRPTSVTSTATSDVASDENSASDVNISSKRQRLARNRNAARESRKRRLARIQQNEHRLKRLEMENIDLKMRLQIGKEAILVERQEKATCKQKMRQMIQSNASEAEIAAFVDQYKAQYSDYGTQRREKMNFHIQRVRDLLLPTQVTKMCLYSVEQADEEMMKQNMVSFAPPSQDSPNVVSSTNLWAILAKELDISDAQARQIFCRREQFKILRQRLSHSLQLVTEFERATQEKNKSLSEEVQRLQNILTPTQATKFIMWYVSNCECSCVWKKRGGISDIYIDIYLFFLR